MLLIKINLRLPEIYVLNVIYVHGPSNPGNSNQDLYALGGL